MLTKDATQGSVDSGWLSLAIFDLDIDPLSGVFGRCVPKRSGRAH
jgi:hypothetical protein